MPTTVNDAFLQLLTWISPSEVESASAASHRSSIESCLRSNFGMTGFFRAGSFGHGTSVSGWSDVDYFAVISPSRLLGNSASSLRELREVLEQRFPRTGVYVDSPAVNAPFGSTRSEHHEITPAYFVRSETGFSVYNIPDRGTGWMPSAPLGHNAYTNAQHVRLANRAKPLIRLIKLWNYRRSGGIRSLYLELRTSECLTGESSIVYSIDILRALRAMRSKGLAAMQDPLGLSGYIYPCSDALKPSALSKLDTAISRAEKAREAESGGRIADAFFWWDLFFDEYFPAYG